MSSISFIRLDDVAEFASGGTPSKSEPRFWGGSIEWLTPKDMVDFSGATTDYVTPSAIGNGTRLAPPNALFIAVRGMSLHTEIRILKPGKSIAFNQDIKAIVPRDIDGHFLYYALCNQRAYLLSAVEAAGHGTGRLPTDKLAGLEIPKFHPSEQRAIAHILGSLDDRIELNRQMNETIEEMAQALFRNWFVDFGPVRAKMEGREPSGFSSEITVLFPDRLDPEGKPEGWEYKLLGQIVDFNPSEKLSKGEIAPYLDMSALPTIGSWPSKPIYRAFGAGMRFRNGDTLVARITPCLENGKTAFVQCLEEGQLAWGSTEFIVMRPKGFVPHEYCYILAREKAFREYAIKNMMGTSGRQRVQAEALAKFSVAVPPDTIWQAFSDLVGSWFITVKANSEQSDTLVAMRDLLLPKLLSRELLVRDAEQFLGDVL